jgi:crossover junction endodeoxyribonuclease RuvC
MPSNQVERPQTPLRILGVDTSLRSTGVGVLDVAGSRMRAVTWGLIRNPPSRPHTACLAHLFEQIQQLIRKEQPVVAAIEGIFFSKNARTAMILGQARGVVLAACALEKIPVYEYSPRSVKMAVVGHGNAHKDQVGNMIQRLLAMKEPPEEDAADALALAICHSHNIRQPLTGQGEAI